MAAVRLAGLPRAARAGDVRRWLEPLLLRQSNNNVSLRHVRKPAGAPYARIELQEEGADGDLLSAEASALALRGALEGVTVGDAIEDIFAVSGESDGGSGGGAAAAASASAAQAYSDSGGVFLAKSELWRDRNVLWKDLQEVDVVREVRAMNDSLRNAKRLPQKQHRGGERTRKRATIKLVERMNGPLEVQEFLEAKEWGEARLQRGLRNKARRERRHEESLRAAARSADEVTAKWLGVPYEEQLRRKEEAVVEALSPLSLNFCNEGLGAQQQGRKKGVDFRPTLHSPRQLHYRNTVELSFGLESDAKTETLGFVASRSAVASADGSSLLSPHCQNLLENLFSPMLRDKALFSVPVYDRFWTDGFWRTLRIRTTESGQALAQLQVNPVDVDRESLEGLSANLAEFVRRYNERFVEWPLTGLLLQPYSGISVCPPDAPAELLAGSDRVREHFGPVTLQMDISSFLQANTPAARLMYDLTYEWATAGGSRVVLFDVCCGSGAIGTFAAKRLAQEGRVAQIFGVEPHLPAIQDCILNSQANGVEGICRWVEGAAEHVLPAMSRSEAFDNFRTAADPPLMVAVVNPPRVGLHKAALRALRNMRIDRIVYIACEPTSIVKAADVLCDASDPGLAHPPFSLQRIQCVDMFPQTPHVETVCLFSRLDE